MRFVRRDIVLVLIMILLVAFVTALVLRIDTLVHVNLYQFGLEFSPDWANEFWLLIRAALLAPWLLLSVAVVALLRQHASPTLAKDVEMKLGKGFPRKLAAKEIVSWGLLAAGAATLVVSFLHYFSALLFVGLGLTFWGALLFYVQPVPYVRSSVLVSTLSPLASINKMIEDKKLQGRGVYLPPKYLRNPESSLVFISSRKSDPLPKPEEVDEERSLNGNLESLYLTPPGRSLCELFERELGTTFTRLDKKRFLDSFPQLVTDDLEIAEDVAIQMTDSSIIVELKANVFADLCRQAAKLEKVCESIGCPLCSAIACALAKVTGKPITIEGEQSKDGGITRVQYRTLQEEN